MANPSADERARAERRRASKSLTLARMALVQKTPFFGRLLLRMRFGFSPCGTSMTDLEKIVIDPQFLQTLDDEHLQFVLLHEIIHCALRHPQRREERDLFMFNLACDIVANSMALASLELETIEFNGHALPAHAPDGTPGRDLTAEEVYSMLIKQQKDQEENQSEQNKDPDSSGGAGGDEGDDSASAQADDPNESQETEKSDTGESEDPGIEDEENEDEAGSGLDNPSDEDSPEEMSDTHDENKEAEQPNSDNAEDNAADEDPNLNTNAGAKNQKNPNWPEASSLSEPSVQRPDGSQIDTHELWEQISSSSTMTAQWDQALLQEAQWSMQAGVLPGFMERVIDDLKTEGKADWLTILNELIRQNMSDYTFSRPDRRVDGPCILPGYWNDLYGNSVEDIWVVVDVSGSISAATLNETIGEVRSMFDALDSVQGYLSFFDTRVTEPMEFDEIEDLFELSVTGGGGTDFEAIFRAMNRYFDELPSMILILTDGFCFFPPEEAAQGVPVAWLITTPWIEAPWGMSISLDPDFDEFEDPF